MLYQLVKNILASLARLTNFSVKRDAKMQSSLDALKVAIDQIQDSLSSISATLAKILAAVVPSPAVKIKILFGGKEVTMQNILDNGSVTASLVGEDAANQVGALDPQSAPVWSVDQPSLASVVASADGLSAVVTPTGKAVGPFNVSCNIPAVNAQPALLAVGACTVVAGSVTQLAMQFAANPAAAAPAPAPQAKQ